MFKFRNKIIEIIVFTDLFDQRKGWCLQSDVELFFYVRRILQVHRFIHNWNI